MASSVFVVECAMRNRRLLVLCFALTMAGCEDPDALKAKALSKDGSLMLDCNPLTIEKVTIGLPKMADEDFASVCKAYRDTLKSLPPVRVYRQLSRTVVALKSDGLREGVDSVAHQLAFVLRARDKPKPEDQENTLEMIYRVHRASNGLVRPQDVHQFLAAAGDLPPVFPPVIS